MSEDILSALEKRGSLRILASLSEGKSHFSELKESSGVANGTIQRRLKMLVDVGLLNMDVGLGETGRARKYYSLTERGEEVSDRIRKIRTIWSKEAKEG